MEQGRLLTFGCLRLADLLSPLCLWPAPLLAARQHGLPERLLRSALHVRELHDLRDRAAPWTGIQNAIVAPATPNAGSETLAMKLAIQTYSSGLCSPLSMQDSQHCKIGVYAAASH